MILVQPKQRAAEQEVPDLVATVIEDKAVPVRMESLPRIGMFIEMRAVELGQPMLVWRKVRRHPVQQHTDSMPDARYR